MNRQIPLREAKAKLSELIRAVESGEHITLTNHGHPVADLVPHGSSSQTLTHLKKPGPLPKPFKLIGEGPTASDIMLADRGPLLIPPHLG